MEILNYRNLKVEHYYRKSSESEDRQALSLDSQKGECERTANFYNLSVPVKIFEESKSAKIAGKRPQFKEMMKDIFFGKVDVIVCWHINRLARNMTEGGVIIDLLSSGQLKAIITPTEVYNQNTDVSVLSLYFGASKQYSKNLSRDVKRGQKTKASMGIPHGVASLGFLNDKTEEKGKRKWLVDEPRLKAIKILFDMFLTGTYSAGKLYKYAVNELKLTTVKRKKTGGALIVTSRIYEILKDPIYAGFFFQGGERYKLDTKLPRLITEEQHKKVKMILSSKFIPRLQTHETAFSGFIKSEEGDYMGPDIKCQLICDCKNKFAYRSKIHCPKCGKEICELENPKYLSYVHYYDVRKKKMQEKYKSVNEEMVTSELLKFVDENLTFSQAFADWSKKYITELKNREINDGVFKKQKEISDKGEFESKKTRMRQMLRDEQITNEEYKTDLEVLNKNYNVNTNNNGGVDWYSKMNEIVDLTLSAKEILENGTIKAKRNILSRLGSNLVWNDKILSIYNDISINKLVEGIKGVRIKNPWFEPKNYVATEGLKEKTEPLNSVYSMMLRRQGSNL